MTTEQILGSHESRYFGQGFRHVTHRITDVQIHPLLGAGALSATATVDYPVDWSVKPDQHRVRPHLSTVDALIITLQLTEAYLTHAHRLDPPAQRRIRPRAFEMRAGAAAQEQLTHVATVGRRATVRLGSLGTPDLVSRFDFRIGSMRLSIETEHPLGTPTSRPTTVVELEHLLGDLDRRQYGRGFTMRRHDIGPVTVDPAISLATAEARIEENLTEDSLPREGMSAADEPALSMVDAAICTAQLAQVLTYSLEGVDRGATGTFWMRRFQMHFATPASPIDSPVTMVGGVVRRKRLDRGGTRWRLYDLGGHVGGSQTFASVAFTIPS